MQGAALTMTVEAAATTEISARFSFLTTHRAARSPIPAPSFFDKGETAHWQTLLFPTNGQLFLYPVFFHDKEPSAPFSALILPVFCCAADGFPAEGIRSSPPKAQLLFLPVVSSLHPTKEAAPSVHRSGGQQGILHLTSFSAPDHPAYARNPGGTEEPAAVERSYFALAWKDAPDVV